ncbi:glycerate kinase family protein [Halobacillus sp. K22]|uniref:glycerate kinase family protein n=1 Tax=Halobacillus sp. K22 TaxID=3457431 RepID=UPI003FCC604C
MKVVIASDSFKGSASAKKVCESVKTGILNVIPGAQVTSLPLADGGEGTMENFVYSSNGKVINVTVTDPIGRAVSAAYGVMGDGETVVIEMAQASGLPLLEKEERDPMNATSYGTGELIKHALDAGFRKFIVGLGGSATNDAGVGMLRALGAEFFDINKDRLPDGGFHLKRLATIEESNIDRRIKDSSFVIASDVTNPLCGPRGASVIYGPQKGASKEMVEELDLSLNHFAKVVLKNKKIDMRKLEGGGAAGGMGAALLAFMGAEFKSGINLMMKEIHFEEAIIDADLVITGEGKLDDQTLSGKVIDGVVKLTSKFNVPVIALCGRMNIEAENLNNLGLLSAFSIVPGPCSLEEAIEKVDYWTIQRTEMIIRLFCYHGVCNKDDEEASV